MTKNQIHEMFPIGPEIRDSRLFNPISAISGAIGIGGNLIGGIMANSAAKKAGDVQQQAGNTAADYVTKTTADVNPQITTAATNAGNQVLGATGAAAQGVTDAATTATAGANTAAGQANALLDPYSQAGTAAAGTLQAGLATGGDFNKTPTGQELLANDPGYAFRIQQAALQSNRSAAARGGAVSGAALSDLNNQIQGVASNEIGNAFNRYETSTQNRFQRLFGEQGVGLQAGTTQGNNLTNAAQYGGNMGFQGAQSAGNFNVGGAQYAGSANMNAANLTAANTIDTAKTAADYRTGGAAAKAAGIVGGTNALTKGISGAANSAVSTLQLLKNPATAKNGGKN